MNDATGYARRYHWLGEQVADFVCEPHVAIASTSVGPAANQGRVLNLVARESDHARSTIAWIAAQERPQLVVQDLHRLKSLRLPHRHAVSLEDIHPDNLARILLTTYERQPEDFQGLLALEGVGAKTLRALSLVAELVYDVPLQRPGPRRLQLRPWR